MKKIFCLAVIAFFILVTNVFAKTVRVRSGLTRNGSYRMPSHRTSPNRTKLDNWSTKGNINPYTGKKGSVDSFKWK